MTKYEPHQEEDCEEKFKKTCYIDYEQKAYTEKVEVCTTPWVKDCEVQESGGSQVCQTIYQSECFTKQTVHQVLSGTVVKVPCQVEDDVAQCKTIQEEKCEQVQEGFTTELKCDTVSAAWRCLTLPSGLGRCARWRSSKSRSTRRTPTVRRFPRRCARPGAAALSRSVWSSQLVSL